MINKNDNLNVQIIDYGCNAEGVAKKDGQVIFIPYSLNNEVIDIKVIQARKNFLLGKIINIISPSSKRITAPCEYYEKCGGCQLQHCIYSESLQIKKEFVQNAINNIAKINFNVSDCVASEKEYHYRNKLAFPINPETKKIGMFRTASHKIIDIDNCIIQEAWCKQLIEIFNKFCAITTASIYNEETGKGLIKHLVARNVNSTLLITVVINGSVLENSNLLIEMLKEKFDNFGLSININKLKNNVILTNNFVHLYGKEEVEITTFNITHSINNKSFMQVNQDIQNLIYQKVLDEITNTSICVDAYSGAGLLTAMISKKCKKAIGIEIVAEASLLADKLAKKNNITNMINICGHCAERLPKTLDSIANNEELIVILDPPRKGCEEKVLNSILKCKPKKVIYISCSPTTLARDLKILTSSYQIKSITPYDMFPQTKHVETLVCLLLK